MIARKNLESARKSLLFRGIGDRQIKKILIHFHPHHLRKGDFLFKANERSRRMYFVSEGKLRIEKSSEQNLVLKIATLVPGDIVGEVAMLTGERHSGQARALTDSSLMGIEKRELQRIIRRHPQMLQNLTRIEAMRLRQNIVRNPNLSTELGLVLHLYSATDSDFAATHTTTTAAISEQKLPGLFVAPAHFLNKTKNTDAIREKISKMLMKNSSLYVTHRLTDSRDTLTQQLVRMADRLVITLSEDAISVETLALVLKNIQRIAALNPLVYTVHHAATKNLLISTIEAKINIAVKARLKLAKNFWETSDHRILKIQCQTFARLATNTSQGIAFGGGGARALSEIGIISELERYKIHFDHVAGTSMGSLIAAFYAQGLTSREMSDKFREFLPNDKGLLRYNLPFISFFRDRSVNRILRRLFGKMRIEDLPKPLTIIAADLISGQEIRIRKGLIWRAVRASMSLPVIFAPVKYHNYYLVDGGAINNVPGNVLRDQGVQLVMGINCTPLEDDAIKEYLASTNLFQLLKPGDKFWRNLRRFFKLLKLFFTRPPILQIANRAMMLEGSELIRQKSREFDILFSPDVARFGLFEFDRREEIIDAGRYYAREHAANLKKIFRRT